VSWQRTLLYLHIRKLYKKYLIWRTDDNLKRRNSLLNCKPVIGTIIADVQQCGWRCTSPWRWVLRSVERQRPLLPFQNLFVASKVTHNSLPSCYSLLLGMSVSYIMMPAWMGPRLQSNSKPSWSSSWTLTQVPQLSQGRFASDNRACALCHGSSANRRHYQYRAIKYGRWAWGKRRKCRTTYLGDLRYGVSVVGPPNRLS
jgi:hypothetical protein